MALHENLGLGAPIRDEAHYEQLLEVAGELSEIVAKDETSPLAGLLPLLADRIREYEDRSHPWPDHGSPATVLASLMQAHGLRQTDLPEVGTQSVVSEVLARQPDLVPALSLSVMGKLMAGRADDALAGYRRLQARDPQAARRVREQAMAWGLPRAGDLPD